MTTNAQVLELLVTMKNTTQADFSALRNDFMRSQEQSDALTGAINRLAVSVDDLSKSQKGNVAASDVMAGGQARASASLTATTASAGQLASVLQTELRVATDDAARAAFLHTDELKGLLPRVVDAQKAVSDYGRALRDVNQDVTAVGTNLRANFKDALAEATNELLNGNEIQAETAAKLNQTELALAKFEAAEKKAAASTVQASSDATYALMRETQAAIKEAETVSAKAQTVIAAEAKEAEGVSASSSSIEQSILREQRALLRLGGEAAGVRQGFALAGVGVSAWAAILGGTAVYAAAKFQTEMQKLQGNTGANADQMKLYTQTVLDLGAKGPASLDDIAVGLRHVSDLGYRNADATTVLTEGWKGAIATGGKVADVANALATVLGNQHEPAAQAARDMDIIVTATQQGNMTLQDFATNYSKVGTIEASLHQPLTDGAAVFATLSRATANPAWAATYEQNMLIHIINPTHKATVEMGVLKDATGIDLAKAFQEFAQHQISMNTLMEETRRAVGGNVSAMENLFGGIKGGNGSLILMNNHWQDYNDIARTVKASNDSVRDSFNDMLKTTGSTLKTAKNDMVELGISLGSGLLPRVDSLAKFFGNAASGLKNLNDDMHGGVARAIEFSLEVLTVVKTIDFVTAAFKRQRVAALAAWAASNPLTAAVAIGAAVAVEFQGHTDSDKLHALEQAQRDVTKAFDEGKTPLATAQAELKRISALAVLTGVDLGKITTAKLEDSKVKYDQKLQAEADATHHLSAELLGTAGAWSAAFGEKKKYYQFDGKDAPVTAKSPQFNVATVVAQAQKDITKYADAIVDDGKKFGEHSVEVELDRKNLEKAKLTYVTYNDELTALTDTTKVLADRTRQLNAPFLADAKAVELHAKAMTSALATIHSVSAAAVSAADALSGRASSQTQGDMATITRSVPSQSLPYVAGTVTPYAAASVFGGNPGAIAPVQPHGTFENAEALSPTDRAAMAKLSSSIDQLPEQFRGSFDGEISKLHNQERDNYNHYIDQVNAENKRHAAALDKAQKQHDDVVQKANDKAQKDLDAEHDRYLHQLDDMETRHNQALADHLASFNVAFQSAMATFESNMVADTQKAEAERQSHNDKLTQDYGALQQRLAGIHGKNAAQLRENAWADYNRRVTHDNQTYGAQVTLMDNHVKGQAKAFTDHINGIKSTLSNANANSDRTLSRQEGNAARNDATARGTISATLHNAIFGPGGAEEIYHNRTTVEDNRHSTALGPTGAPATTLSKADQKTADQAKQDALPVNMMARLTAGKDTEYNKAYAQVFMDIIKHHGQVTAADTAALQKASTDRQIITDAQNKATALATANIYDFATAVSATAKAISDDKNVLAGILVKPDDGNAEATRNRFNTKPGQSQQSMTEDATRADLLQKLKDQRDQTAANLEVDKWAAIQMKDFATAAADAKTQYLKGATTLADYVGLQKQANDDQDRQNQLLLQADQALGDFIGAAQISKDAYLRGVEGIDQYVRDQQAADDQLRQQNDRQILYDQRVGNTSDALKLLTDEYHKNQISVETLTAAYRANQDTIHNTNQQDIDYYQHIGDTADALKVLTDEYHNGYASITQLTDAYNANRDAVEKTTQQDLAFYMSTGQFGQALTTLTGQITQSATDSQAKVTLDVLTGNQAAMKADTDSAIAHREAQDALTSATWDATYATASAATQSQMRSSLAQPMISQQSTVQGAESAVFTAQLGVIAARSAVQISLMQAEVTATNDLAGIISAQAGVAKAQGDKLLAGINDQIPLMNDNHAIAEDLKSGNAQQLQIDKQQLLIDVTTAQMDQVVAQWQITLAQDQLKMAQDKMLVDQMNAAAAYAVAVDNLQIAQDNVAVVQAQSQIQIDQLSVQTDISTSLGSVIDYLTMIDGDLQNLQAAQDQMQSDQSTLADDTSNQNFVNMSGQGILAGDSLGLASDQANSQAAQQAYELQIAQYKVQLNAFQLQQKDSTTNAQSTAALEAMVRLLQNMIVNLNSPAGRTVRAAGVGGVSLAHLQNSFAASAYTTQLPMGFA